jgi:branched-chain amino acid transport system permease protein
MTGPRVFKEPDDEAGVAVAAEAQTPSDVALAPARKAAGRSSGPGKDWVSLSLVAAFFVVLVVVANSSHLGTLTTLTTALLTVAVAQGWNLLGGYGGYLNFGIGVLYGAGVYTAALLNSHLGWGIWATILPAGLLAVLVGIPIGLVTLRLRGFYFAIFTLILVVLVQVIVFDSPSLGGVQGIYTTLDKTGDSRTLAIYFFYIFLGLAVLATVVAYLVERSKFGHALRAVREDEDGARVIGVRTFGVKLRALLLGSALAGMTGGVAAFMTGYVEPTGTFDLSFSIDVVLVVLIGGLGSWQGPLIGAMIVIPLEQWLRVTIPSLSKYGIDIPAGGNRVVLGLLLLGFALFAPRGVVGIVRRRLGRRSSI